MSEELTLSVIGIGIAVATAIILWIQIHKQTKVDSARFTVEYLDKILVDHQEIIKKIRKKHIDKDNSVVFDDRDVRVFLNNLENVVLFEKQKVLRKDHILNEMGWVLRTIKNDDFFQEVIKTEQKNNDKAYIEIVSFLADL